MSIFKTQAPAKATPENPAISSLTGRTGAPPRIPENDVKHAPNADGGKK